MTLNKGFGIARIALKRHKVRTFLASLGIVVGIAAVIIMVAVGKGSQKEVMDIIQDHLRSLHPFQLTRHTCTCQFHTWKYPLV